MPIRLVVFDIDGVLTDGTILVDGNGNEQKRVSLKDIDAMGSFHREGYLIAAITGEETALAEYFEKRIPWDSFMMGRKDKGEALRETMSRLTVTSEETVYIGNGKYDLEPLRLARHCYPLRQKCRFLRRCCPNSLYCCLAPYLLTTLVLLWIRYDLRVLNGERI